jgi:uncharacterized coiled-coil protein SlyX
MRAVEERLTYLEGRSREQQVMVDELGREVANLRKDMNRGFDSLGRRLEILDERVGRQFVWLVGIQVMTLAAVVTSLAAILGALADR